MLPGLGYLLFAELLTTVYAADTAPMHVFADMVFGRFAPIFWFDLVIGLLVPGAILMLKGRSTIAAAVSAVMTISGIFAERVLIVLPSQLNREFLSGTAQYTPTATEWWLIAGVWAAGVLMLTLLAKAFPLVPMDEEV